MIMKNNILKKCLIYALMVTIMVVQKWLLAIIPNFQFTTLLIILFFFVFGIKPTIVITILYVIVDNLYMGTFHLVYTPIMALAWLSLILLLLPFKKCNNIWILALIGSIHGIIYAFCYALGGIIFYQIDIIAYMLADIPFTILLIVSNFITIIWLYKPLYKVLCIFLSENVCEKK